MVFRLKAKLPAGALVARHDPVLLTVLMLTNGLSSHSPGSADPLLPLNLCVLSSFLLLPANFIHFPLFHLPSSFYLGATRLREDVSSGRPLLTIPELVMDAPTAPLPTPHIQRS